MFVVPWWLCELHDSVWVGCRRRPEHWVGTQLNIGSVSLSNTKRLLTGCLHSFMRGVGFTNVFIFCMRSFACSGFGVSYPPILIGYEHSWLGCKLNSIAALFPATNSRLWGKEHVIVSIGHLHLLQNSHWNVWEYVNFKKCRCWANLKTNAGNLIIILLFSLCWVQ